MNKKKENYIKIKTKTNTFIINPKAGTVLHELG